MSRIHVELILDLPVNIDDSHVWSAFVFIDVDDELSNIGALLPAHPTEFCIVEEQGWI